MPKVRASRHKGVCSRCGEMAILDTSGEKKPRRKALKHWSLHKDTGQEVWSGLQSLWMQETRAWWWAWIGL